MLRSICKWHKLLLVTYALVIIPTTICEPENSDNAVSESWGSTHIKISKLKYTWTLSNFKYCCHEVGEIIKSPPFSANDECKWNLDIRPKGEDEEKKDYVALFLYSLTCNTSVEAKLSILNSKGEQTISKTFNHKYELGKGWGFSEYVLESYLLNADNDLLPDNKLTIICEITATEGRENSIRKFEQPKRNYVEDFGLLLDNQVLTDVTLTAGPGGKEFYAHKAILAARSPIFKDRFESDLTNNTVVEIPDVDSKTLSELLHYIYTDEVLNLEKVAPKLLAVADYLELDGLKTLSENRLRSDLSIENAVDYYILSDKYCAKELKKEAKEFIFVHASNITYTDKFKSLVLVQPRLAVETLDLLG